MTDPPSSRSQAEADAGFIEDPGFFRRLVQEGADVYLLVAHSGAVLWINAGARTLLGRSREEWFGRDFLDFVDAADRERTAQAFGQWIETDATRPEPFENRLVDTDGRLYEMRWNIRRRKSGSDTCLILSGQDISLHKERERELRASDARHRALLSGALEPLIIIDGHGVIQSVSDSVLPVFGYRPEELIGGPVGVLMPSPHYDRHLGYLAKYNATGEAHTLNRTREFQVVRKDGERIDCELSVSRVDIPGQDDPLFIGSLRDVTQRRRVERELLQREAVFRAIFDQEFQYVGLCATDGTLLEANRAMLSAIGTQLEAVRGKPFWELPWLGQTDESRAQMREGIRRAIGGEFVRFQLEFVRSDSAPRIVDFSLKPIFDEGGELSMLIPEGRDVTDFEAARRSETQMYKALAEIGESAAILAHEVKNPITAINLALRAVAGQLGEDSKAVVDDLVSRMQTLECTLRTTLSFVKPLKLDRVQIGSLELTNDVLACLRVELVRAGVIVDLCDDFQDVTLDVDVTKVHEVFDNLMRNAMQATGDGGRIVIRCSRDDSGMARFAFEDDGCGIPQHQRAAIFKPFVTLRPTGTGLGLPICRRIIEEHGGTIEAVDSALGGACIQVRIPMRENGRLK